MFKQNRDVEWARRGPKGGMVDFSGPEGPAWALVFIGGAIISVMFTVYVGGWLAAFLSGSSEGPSFGFGIFLKLFSGGVTDMWPEVPSFLLYLCICVVAAMFIAAGVTLYYITRGKFGYIRPGLAGEAELKKFMFEARSEEAVRLRPKTLDGMKPASLQPNQVGIPLGKWHGKDIIGGWEDVSIAIMAPRSGKTSAIGVPQIISAPGPVVVTSNKSDIFSITVEKRQRDHPNGRIWAFDPQDVVQAEPNWFWNPLAHVEDFDSAMELALMFVMRKEADDQSTGNAEFFQSAGRNYLAYLFLAAALPTKTAPPATLSEVDAWLDTSDPMDAIFRLQAAGQQNHAKALKATVDGPPETVGGIIATARDAAVALKSEKIIRWVTPGDGREEFSPEEFIDSEDTLYLMSNEKSASAAAPLIAAFASRLFDVGAEQAGRRYKMRLDPPLVAVLDEAANICKIPGLPGGYSHYGSRGICVTSIFQNSHQPVRVWGRNAWQEMWSAATVKLIGPGIDDPNFAEELSKLVGQTDQDVGTHSSSKQGSSYSVTVRQENILSASEIRTIDKDKMLMLATATKPAMLSQVRYYQGEHADELSSDEKAVANLITERAAEAAEKERLRKAELLNQSNGSDGRADTKSETDSAASPVGGVSRTDTSLAPIPARSGSPSSVDPGSSGDPMRKLPPAPPGSGANGASTNDSVDNETYSDAGGW